MKKIIALLTALLLAAAAFTPAFAVSFGPASRFGLLSMLEEYEAPEGYAIIDWTEWIDAAEPQNVFLLCTEGVDELIATAGYEGLYYLECTFCYADDSDDAPVTSVYFSFRVNPQTGEADVFSEFMQWIVTACCPGLTEEEAADLFAQLKLTPDLLRGITESGTVAFEGDNGSSVSFEMEINEDSFFDRDIQGYMEILLGR